MINQCLQCCLWQKSVLLLCQELYGLALVVASQDRSAVGSGPGQREQATEEGPRTAIPPGYWLDILSALGAADGGTAQVSIESCKETSVTFSPQHKSQGPPPGSLFWK